MKWNSGSRAAFKDTEALRKNDCFENSVQAAGGRSAAVMAAVRRLLLPRFVLVLAKKRSQASRRRSSLMRLDVRMELN